MRFFFFFSSLLELSKVLETFYLLPEKWFWLQHDKCTEWHFIFWLLFSTNKPRGIGNHSSTWENRNSLWPCFGKKACLVFYLLNQGTFKLHSAAQQAQRFFQSPLPIEEFLWDFKAWFWDLLAQITHCLFKRKKKRFILLNMEVGCLRLVDVNR